MNKADLISLIENNQAEKFVQQVFENQVCGSSKGFYTVALSADEEKALLHRVASEQKNSVWYKALTDYMAHYPLSNGAVEYLLSGISNALAVKIICSQFAKYSYTPDQGEKVCRIIKDDSGNRVLLPLLSAISKNSRRFDETIYNLLWRIDERLREQKVEKTDYAASYKKNSYNYLKQNGLLSYVG